MTHSATPSLATPIRPDTIRARREALLVEARKRNAKGYVWWGNTNIFYLSGFAFIPTERPVAFLMSAEGESVLFVPRLELEHAEAYAHVDRVVSYPEYPDWRHPMEHLAEQMKVSGLGQGTLLGDGEGYPHVMGYQGPKLPELLDVSCESIAGQLEKTMQVKGDEEIALIRESARWAGRAHRLLQDYTQVGVTETEVSMRAGFDAGQELLAEYGDRYRALSWGRGGPSAGYRGQIGVHSAYPHSLSINAVFKPGDTLVTGATCPMFGYWSELERTMFIGEPSEQQRRYFAHMLALQDLAIARCRAGESCASVDRAVRDYFEAHGLMSNWRHHTGHNIGIRYHEGPFLDVGDETVIEAGMLFTVEPGVYVEGLGGFRHSDTILVTDEGPEFLTGYPRDLESLIIPA